MATRTLGALIRASGHTPAAGMSFRNHVAGAGTGAAMSHYRCDDWINWSSSDYTANPVASGTTFHWSFNFSCGPRFFNIMPPFSAIVCFFTTADDMNGIGGSSAYAVSGSLSTTGTSYVGVRVEGMPVPASMLRVDYNGWADHSPGYIPPDNGDYAWRTALGFVPPVVGGADSGNLHIVYPGDAGNFNDELRKIYPVTVERRIAYPSTSGVEVEWYSSNSYSPAYLLQSGGFTYEFMVGPSGGPTAQMGNLYIRYRMNASSPWQYIAQSWRDTRF
jgi:hypothetical protein